MARRSSGRHDFVRTPSGDLARTDDWSPAMIRLLVQSEWIGDDGEREGEALPDVQFINGTTEAQVRRIVSRRLGKLVDRGVLASVKVLRFWAEDDRFWVEVATQRPGREPDQPMQIPVLK